MPQGVAYPPGAPMLGTYTTLFRLVGADMNTTADQRLIKPLAFSRSIIEKIVITNASGPLTGAIGGFYTGAAKTGTVLVLATQAYSAMNTTTKVLNPSLTAAATEFRADSDVFFSLTTPLGSAGTADIYFMGFAA